MASVLYDAVFVAGGQGSVDTLRGNGGAIRYVAEAFKHAKPVAAIGEGIQLLREAPLDDVRLSDDGPLVDAGVVTLASTTGNGFDEFSASLAEAIAGHRDFDRRLELVPA